MHSFTSDFFEELIACSKGKGKGKAFPVFKELIISP
jgi:hypothetical protein